MPVRFSVDTTWRSGRGENCKRCQDESRQAGQCLSSLGSPCGQIKCEHLLLTTQGRIRSRVARCIPDGHHASYHAEVHGLFWETITRNAEMLRNVTVRSAVPPRQSREEGPQKTGLQHKRRQRPRQDKKKLVTIPCHWAEHRGGFRNCESVWWRSRSKSVENGSRRRYFSRRAGTTKICKQPARRSLTHDAVSKTETRGDNCFDRTRDSQNDSCIEKWRDRRVVEW